MPVIVTQLVVDASGAKTGVAEFEAAMTRAKATADSTGQATGQSFDTAMKKWVSSLAAADPVMKAQIAQQQALAKQQAIGTQAVMLGIASQDAAAAALAKVKASTDAHVQSVREQTGQLTAGQGAWLGIRNAMSGVSGQLVALAAGAGPVGVFLSAIPGWGQPAAIALGAVTAVFSGLADASHALAQKAEEIKRLSAVTDLSTATVQALRSEWAKFGLTNDEATAAIEHFTSGFNQLRLGQGDLLAQIKRVNPALADQMQMTTNASDALTLFGKVLAQVDDIFQRNALVKAATGKGGLISAEFLTNLNVDKVTQSFVAADKGLSDGLIKKLPQVEVEINKIKSGWSDAFSKKVAEPMLDTELAILQTGKSIGDTVANIKLSDDLKAFITFVTYLPKAGINFAIDPSANFRTAPLRSSGPADLNDATRTASYQAPARTTGMADLDDPTRVQAYKDANKTLEAQAEDLKKLNELLGAGATFQQQYNAQLAELNVRAKDAKVSHDDLNYQIAKGAIDLELAAKQTSALNNILGAAATVQDQYRARVQQIAKEQQAGAGATDAQITNAKRIALAQADGTLALKGQIDALNIQAGSIGKTTAEAETYTLIQSKMRENLRLGKPEMDGVKGAFEDMANAQGKAKQIGELAVTLDQAQFDAKTVFLGSLEKEIALLQKKNGINPQTQEIADLKRVTDAEKTAQEAGIQFAQTLVQGLFDAKAGTDSVSKGFEALAKSLASTAIKQLLSGDFEKAAVSAISATVSWIASLVTHTQDLKGAIALIDKINALQTRNIAATSDNSLSAQLAAFDQNANLQRIQEARDGGAAMVELEHTLSLERTKIISDFNAQSLADAQQAAAAQEQVMQAAQQRIQSAQDRLFNATNDPNSLTGQLDAFDRQAAADQLAEQQAGGQAMVDLEAAQGQERLNIIKDYNQKITDAATQAAQAQLDAVTKAASSIVDYLNGLNVGSDSSLSPQQKLDAATQAYNAKYALAQGGNQDALSSITTDAENLRKAAQDFYASGSGYQAILSSIQTGLLHLPAVATSTDPVVSALRDVLTAVQATTGAVGNTTVAVGAATNAVTSGTIQTTDSIDAGNALAESANSLQLTANAILNSQTSLLTAINSLSDRDVSAINGLGNLTANIASTHSNQFNTMITLLGAIANKPASGGGTIWSWLGFQHGGMVPGYAGGGMIGNGAYNVDSVRARYAGGGDIALAGGEFITRATSVNSATLSALQFINQTGRAPANDNRDYTPMFNGLMRVSAAGSNAVVEVLERRLASLEDQLRTLNSTVRQSNNQRARPGAALAQKQA